METENQREEKGDILSPHGAFDTLRKENESATASAAGGGHKRSLSGSILAKLSFLSTSSPEIQNSQASQPSSALSPTNLLRNNGPLVSSNGSPVSSKTPNQALAAALQEQKKSRKRKGSLRKTALLGIGSKSRPIASSSSSNTPPSLALKPQSYQPASQHVAANGYSDPSSPEDTFNSSNPAFASRINKLGYANGRLQPPVSGPTSPNASTTSTDEEDVLTFSRPKPSSSNNDSYFPPLPPAGVITSSSMVRRHSSRTKRTHPTSPLSTVSPPSPTSAGFPLDYEDHPYDTTANWGYVILLTTWMVFVVGMGSCLDVWSWAWDVGETPYAPPELEDDPTLPIVGYYPALFILTAVMAWVWVVVAWVGMKYFRHAKLVAGGGDLVEG